MGPLNSVAHIKKQLCNITAKTRAAEQSRAYFSCHAILLLSLLNSVLVHVAHFSLFFVQLLRLDFLLTLVCGCVRSGPVHSWAEPLMSHRGNHPPPPQSPLLRPPVTCCEPLRTAAGGCLSSVSYKKECLVVCRAEQIIRSHI